MQPAALQRDGVEPEQKIVICQPEADGAVIIVAPNSPAPPTPRGEGTRDGVATDSVAVRLPRDSVTFVYEETLGPRWGGAQVVEFS
jgi:hypothetical protein